MTLLVAACAAAPRTELTLMPEAAAWPPLIAASFPTLAPPGDTSADEDAVRAWQTRRTAEDLQAIAYWQAQPSALRWHTLACDMAAADLLPPPAAARALAAVSLAMADACAASWRLKAAVRRAPPGAADPQISPLGFQPGVPGFPNEHAAIAAAAGLTLGTLFPVEAERLLAKARAVAALQTAAGLAYPSDVSAGWTLGEAAAAAVGARLASDGYDASPPPLKPAGTRFYDPEPVAPGAGRWRPWLALAPSVPASPLAQDTPAFQAALAAAVQQNRGLSIRERALAEKWLSESPVVLWNRKANALLLTQRLPAPQATRLLAWLNAGLADGLIACFDAQYRVRRPRPEVLAPAIEPVIFTPSQPAWPADSALTARYAVDFLSAAFPASAPQLARDGIEAVPAGAYAGWHYADDIQAGAALGTALAERVLSRARQEGSLPN